MYYCMINKKHSEMWGTTNVPTTTADFLSNIGWAING